MQIHLDCTINSKMAKDIWWSKPIVSTSHSSYLQEKLSCDYVYSLKDSIVRMLVKGFALVDSKLHHHTASIALNQFASSTTDRLLVLYNTLPSDNAVYNTYRTFWGLLQFWALAIDVKLVNSVMPFNHAEALLKFSQGMMFQHHLLCNPFGSTAT